MVKNQFQLLKFSVQAALWSVFIALAEGTGTSTTSRVCSGICTRDQSGCKNQGGRVFGTCENGYTCCDTTWKDTGFCGAIKTGRNPVYFASPDYPSFLDRDLVCTFVLNLVEDVIAVKIDYLDIEMDGLGYFPRGAMCESDMFVLKGFKTWTPPPLCGNFTGYSTLIERSTKSARMDHLGIVALMSSNRYRWRLKITPVLATNGRISNPSPHNSNQLQTTLNPRRRGKRSSENVAPDISFVEPDGRNEAMSLESLLITNGFNTTSFEVPWQVSLRTALKEPMNETLYTTSTSRPYVTTLSTNETDSFEAKRQCYLEDGMHFCGGIIISDRHILTAAHCFYAVNKAVDFIPPEELKVVLGDTNRCTKDANVQQDHAVESITLHYAYDPVGVINDVAVVKLKKPIAFKRNVQKIKMAGPKQTFDGERAYVSGWGMQNLTEESAGLAESPPILKLNDRFVIRNQSGCNAEQLRYIGLTADVLSRLPKYQNLLDSVICTQTFTTASGQAHVGQGDSGGPVVVKTRSGENVVVGIVSHSIPNADPLNVEEPTDFYASVAFYRNWIDLAMTL